MEGKTTRPVGRPRKSAGSVGINVRHSRGCNVNRGGGCTCEPTFEAFVYSKRDKRKIRKSFPTQAAAKGWRLDAMKDVKDRKLRAVKARTLRQEVDEWLAGANNGSILNRQERRYKPGALRIYERSLRLRVLPELGHLKLTDIARADLLRLKERMQGEGCSASVIRNAFVPLQAVLRRALDHERITVNPARDLKLPTPEGRKRAATSAQAEAQLAALGDLAPIWATAFYAGLRRGELQALRVRNVNLAANLISVESGWDIVEGEIAVKSAAGYRTVFICETLKTYLEPPVNGRDEDAFVFGTSYSPFDTRMVARKAERYYDAAGLEHRFTLHEARHSFSTFLINAGVSPTWADVYMGHAAQGAAGGYRHLLPSQIAEDARRLDEYLAGAITGKVVELLARDVVPAGGRT
jgi:integrase